jgi:tetratricopeptide (TPR) repeat protein
MKATSHFLWPGVCVAIVITGCDLGFLQSDATPQHMTQAPMRPEPYNRSSNDRAPSHRSLPVRFAATEEVDLVEQVVANRDAYLRSVSQLHRFYVENGYHDKAQWSASELADIRRIQPFRYIMSAQVPQVTMSARESIMEADALYDRGVNLMNRGGDNIPIFYNKERMVESLKLFRRLIDRYPSSDKIDDAAYHCGRIHKEYLKDQDIIAAQWFERAFEWNSQTPYPARFQAAIVYDYRLGQHAKALDLYRKAVTEERNHSTNVFFANRRIAQLGRKVTANPEPPTDMFGMDHE